MGQKMNFLRSIQEQLTPEDQLQYELDDELPNEFGDNSEIIYGSFRHRFPLGELSNLIGDGSVPEAVTKRLLRSKFANPASIQCQIYLTSVSV